MNRIWCVIAASLFVAALSVLLAVNLGSSPVTANALAAEACPADPPSSSYAQAAIDWMRTRGGNSSPLSSPAPASELGLVARSFDSPLPTPSPTPPSDWPYVVLAYNHVYFPELTSCYVAVTILNQETGQIDKLLVDLTSYEAHPAGEIDELLIQANRSGPAQVDPEVTVRLNSLKPGETVTVMVWLRTPHGKDLGTRQHMAYMRLAEMFPEAKRAIEEFGNPFSVQDEALLRSIRTEYEWLMSESIDSTAMLEVTDLLSRERVVYRPLSPLPAIAAELTRQIADTLLVNPHVERLYLLEKQPEDSLLDAGATHHTSSFGALGLDGANTVIGILEPGNVQQNNRYLTFFPTRLVSGNGDTAHATNVAACAGSSYEHAAGSALRAQILSAGTTTEQLSAILGLQWVSGGPYWTDTVNYSQTVCTGTQIQGITRAFDYWARANNTVITVAAGNEANNGGVGEYVCSPANGYNVVAVGSFRNQNTADWSDDTVSSFSSWRDPESTYPDREKPDAVAVGEQLSLWGSNDMLSVNQAGTSLAAPQVAGLSAVLTKRDGALRHSPEAVKAILVASADHNIEAETTFAGFVDTRDGAGSIDGDWAIQIAKTRRSSGQCKPSCWSASTTNGLAPGHSHTTLFWAIRGQRVRCSLAWWATADSEPYASDILDNDLDLLVKAPDLSYPSGSISASFDNNVELVDFTAPQTGWYTLSVQKSQRTRVDAPPTVYGIGIMTTRETHLPFIVNQ